jgi:hypothetical protein
MYIFTVTIWKFNDTAVVLVSIEKFLLPAFGDIYYSFHHYVIFNNLAAPSRAQRQDSSIPPHGWSKLVFVTFHQLSKVNETFLQQ